MVDLGIRNASENDARFIAWLILTAGRAHVTRGIWEVVLDLPEENCLSFLKLVSVTKIPHLFHHSCYLLAEAEGAPVSGLGGYDPDTHGYQQLMEALPEVFKKLGKSPTKELASGEPPRITESIPPSVPGAWTIDSVATISAFRRRGIVDKLLDNVLELGRGKGYKQAQISIYMGNIAAKRAYEKHGFKLLDEWPDPYFQREIGSPGMARMICDL